MENLFGNLDLKDKGSLREHFIVPPFSVLNTTTQDWLRRKHYWLRRMESGGNEAAYRFDPVLAEVLMTWFSDAKHKVLDPFSKDKSTGFVASALKRKFTGLLDKEILQNVSPNSYDFVFTIPEYVNKANLFNTYELVLKSIFSILKKNRFACIIINDSRMLNSTINIMQRIGFKYYNEIIVIRSAGILRAKVGQMMNISRKVGRIHQNVLVFYKGDPAKIKDEFSKL